MPSSVVASYHYDPLAAILTVVFVSGLIYKYKNVPEEVYKEMKAVTSKGTFLNRRIKGKYAFEKAG